MRKSTAIENCKCYHPIWLYSPRLNRFRYTWNGENRMICAVEAVVPTNRPATTIDYAYDHQGRMVTKNIAGMNTVARTLLWDDYNIVRELDNGIATHNIWGLDLDGTLQGCGGVGGLLAVAKTNDLHVALYDANGNVSEYVAPDGTIAAHYEYSSYGKRLISETSFFTHQFGTKPFFHTTGCLEFQKRFINPIFGRWLSRDIIDGEDINLYAYCRNAPQTRIDNIGLKSELIIDPPGYSNVVWSYKSLGPQEGGHVEHSEEVYCERFPADPSNCKGQGPHCCWGIKCVVRIKLTMFINSDDNPFKNNLSGVYGHEQRHIKAYQEDAQSRIQPILETTNVSFYGGSVGDSGSRMAETRFKEMINEIIIEMNNRARWHNPPHPRDGKPYAPLGTVPPAIQGK